MGNNKYLNTAINIGKSQANKKVKDFLVSGYYSGLNSMKSIQKSNKFFVFIENNDFKDIINAGNNKLNIDTSDFDEILNELRKPEILPWHVLGVTVPEYPFGKETWQVGQYPYNFPLLRDFDGFEINLNVEEDSFGTVSYFINYMIKKIVNPDGTYNSQSDNRIQKMIIITVDDNYLPINKYVFSDLFFLNASDLDLNYENNDSIKYDITLCADLKEFYPLKINELNNLQNNFKKITQNLFQLFYF